MKIISAHMIHLKHIKKIISLDEGFCHNLNLNDKHPSLEILYNYDGIAPEEMSLVGGQRVHCTGFEIY